MNIPNLLLEITIYAAAIFGIILLLKKVLAEKMSPRLHFLIWFLLIARLCLPVTFNSGWNPIVLPENAVQQLESMVMDSGNGAAEGDTVDGAQEAALDSVAPQIDPDTNTTQQATTSGAGIAAAGDMLPQRTESQPIPWQVIILLVWAGGMAVCAARAILNAQRLKRILSCSECETKGHFHSLYRKCIRQLGIMKDIPLYLTDIIATPALTVGLNPTVIMPYSTLRQLNDDQVVFAMKHELMHYKRKDHLTGLLMKLLEAVYWFNPIVWIMEKQMTEDMETACDSDVVRSMKPVEKKAYALTLLQLFSKGNEPVFALGMALDSRQMVAEKRIRGVYQKPKSKVAVIIVALLVCMCVFVGCFTTSLQPVYEQEPTGGQELAAYKTAMQESEPPQPTAAVVDGQTAEVVQPELMGRADPQPQGEADTAAEEEITTEAEQPEALPSAEPAPASGGIEIKAVSDEEELWVNYQYIADASEYLQVTYGTRFEDAAEGYAYNIWKASDRIGVTKVEPGETWSFNNAVGNCTYDNGWKGAPGSSDGEYAEEAGSGVCQVATTLYNALLRAELEIVEHTVHVWPIDYAPGGLDATVSTGGPDLVFRNNLDAPVYIVMECDGNYENLVRASILRPPFADGYTRDFSSELLETFGGDEVENMLDPDMPEGESAQIIGGHEGKVFQIYKELMDGNGDVTERAEYGKVTYQPTPAKFRVGTGEVV